MVNKEELLKEAKRRYPIGTKFYLAHKCETVSIIKYNNFYFGEADNIYWSKRKNGYGGCVWYNGNWAEIISKPEITFEIW